MTQLDLLADELVVLYQKEITNILIKPDPSLHYSLEVG